MGWLIPMGGKSRDNFERGNERENHGEKRAGFDAEKKSTKGY
jgi:hypothetical protein